MVSLRLPLSDFPAGIAMFQDHLLYFPERASVAEMSWRRVGLSPWPTASDFRGLLAEPDVAARATAIVFHGNAGHAGHRQFYAGVLTRLGLRVILAEYPAYGPRPGELGEKSLVADAEQTIALARHNYGGPLLIIGESLGAGVAAAASDAQREADRRPAADHAVGPARTRRRHHYPLLPVQWLLRDRYDSVAHLASFGRPVLVAIAADDEIVPPQFGRALYAALAEPKRLAVIEGARHNDWFDRLDAPGGERRSTSCQFSEGLIGALTGDADLGNLFDITGASLRVLRCRDSSKKILEEYAALLGEE
jgi:pimeloyl-ACP methyl ester carboxylesterase